MQSKTQGFSAHVMPSGDLQTSHTEAWITAGDRPLQQWNNNNPPSQRQPAHPSQFHVSITNDSLCKPNQPIPGCHSLLFFPSPTTPGNKAVGCLPCMLIISLGERQRILIDSMLQCTSAVSFVRSPTGTPPNDADDITNHRLTRP